MTIIRRLTVFAACLFAALAVHAQKDGQKFSPEKFQADMEMFIVREAGLTKEEADKFFPLYNEMKAAQRSKVEAMKKIASSTYKDDASWRGALKQYDKLDAEQKEIERTYHTKFLAIISAKKIFAVIKAETDFHRESLKKMHSGGEHRGGR